MGIGEEKTLVEIADKLSKAIKEFTDNFMNTLNSFIKVLDKVNGIKEDKEKRRLFAIYKRTKSKKSKKRLYKRIFEVSK